MDEREEPERNSRRRAGDRRKVLLGGKLVYGAANFSCDCTIRDLTPAGGRVRIPAGLTIHEPVWLIRISAGQAHRATVVWRRPPELGLHFEETVDLREPVAGPLNALRRLWLETAAR